VIREQVASGIRQPIALIAEMLRRGQKRGVIDRTVQPRGAARAIVAMFQGIVLQRLWGESISTSEAMQVFETFLAGLAAKR
jgi:hypothetical protein